MPEAILTAGQALAPAEVQRLHELELTIDRGISSGRRTYADVIGRAWRQITTEVVLIGDALIDAKAKLPHGEFVTMLEADLPFTPRTAQMLMAIAEHPVLSKTNHGSHLPASWRTLYELTRLPIPVLKKAITDGRVNPKMERKDVAALLRPNPPASKAVIDVEAKVALEEITPEMVEGITRLNDEELPLSERRREWEHGLIVGAQAAIEALRDHPDFQVLTEKVIAHIRAEAWRSPQARQAQITAGLREYVATAFSPRDPNPTHQDATTAAAMAQLRGCFNIVPCDAQGRVIDKARS